MVLLAAGCAAGPGLEKTPGTVSPVEFRLVSGGEGELFYTIRRGETVVIEPSSLGPGMTQDGTPPAVGPIRRLKSREFTDEFFGSIRISQKNSG
jgi:hypothetical protein